MTLFQRAAHAVIRANDQAKLLPAPERRCRVMDDYNEILLMFRNRERYTAQSLSTQSPSVSPPKHRAVDCTQQRKDS